MTQTMMRALTLVSATWLAGCGVQVEAEEGVDTQQSAVTIGGLILAKWNFLGGAAGVMGNVVTDELDTEFHTGRYNLFDHGRILWKGGTSEAFGVAHPIDGAYGFFGWEWSLLGFPTSNEFSRGFGAPSSSALREQRFENGLMRVNTNTTAPAWPVLTKLSTSELATKKWPRITNASLPSEPNGSSCLKNFSGAGFKNGATISVFINNPVSSSQVSGTVIVRTDGTFTLPTQTGSACILSTTMKKINGGVTLEARDTSGKRAALFVTTAAGGTFSGEI